MIISLFRLIFYWMSFLKWILTPGGRKCSERVRAFNSVTQHHSHETTRHIMIISLFLLPRFRHSTRSNQNASCLELTAVGNDDLGTSLARLGAIGLDSLNNILALLNGAEHTMLAVQPGGGDCAEEELGTVGVRTSVGHGEDSGARVLEGEVLVGLGDHVGAKLHDNAPEGLTTRGDVEENFR